MADKAKFALVIIAGILALQFVGILTIACIGVVKYGESKVPTEMWDLARTTITLLVGVAGSMYLNGRTKKEKVEEKEEDADSTQAPGKRDSRLHL